MRWRSVSFRCPSDLSLNPYNQLGHSTYVLLQNLINIMRTKNSFDGGNRKLLQPRGSNCMLWIRKTDFKLVVAALGSNLVSLESRTKPASFVDTISWYRLTRLKGFLVCPISKSLFSKPALLSKPVKLLLQPVTRCSEALIPFFHKQLCT